MKLFAILGLATLVYADNENEGAVVRRRRRLAITKCSFPSSRAGVHDPNFLGSFSWTMDAATADSKLITLKRHDYRCCVDKHPGFSGGAKKLQLACTDAASDECVKGPKDDDKNCKAADAKKKTFFSPGYSFTQCNTQYADDCRSYLTCDTAGGFSGYPDLACQAANFNGDFSLRGCGRGDLGTLGSTLTKNVFIVAENTAPVQENGNKKNSFAECAAKATHFMVNAMVAGNGGCDMDNVCNAPDNCAVLPSFDDTVQASESEDTYLRPFTFKSKLNEKCIAGTKNKQPTGAETEKACTGNAKSNSDTASYGGFDFYGKRLNCWRNLGGGMAGKENFQVAVLDLTYEVVTSEVNAGIAVTIKQFELDRGKNAQDHEGIWSGDKNVDVKEGKGFGVCTGVDGKKLGGCTAELAAIMCEAYNKKLVIDYIKKLVKDKVLTTVAKENALIDTFCVGYTLMQSTNQLGQSGTYKIKKKTFTYNAYPTTAHDHDMLVGFFSKANNDADHNPAGVYDGGYFKYVPIANCLVTSSVSCSWCETCVTGFFRTSDGNCIATCPKFQYVAPDGSACLYRKPHCLEGAADGSKCTKCRTGFKISAAGDGTCEETGCTVPEAAKMLSLKADVLVGYAQGVLPKCIEKQNLVPTTGNAGKCGITCPTGKYSSDNKKTVVYSCTPAKKLVAPTIVCTKCTLAKCTSCPANSCDTCEKGYVLSADKKKCDAKPCPYGGSAGSCTACPDGTAGTLGWSYENEDWDASVCKPCTVENCQKCPTKEGTCTECGVGYGLSNVGGVGAGCKKLGTCARGQTGAVKITLATGAQDKTACKADTDVCEDATQTKGECTDCKDGSAGSVDWDFEKQEWNKDQCHAVKCPLDSETSPNCKNCPAFTAGTPVWDDLFNTWAGCVANDFGFSGPSASWAGSVSADRLVIETKSAEMLHVANSQYDAIKEEWVCDEGFAGQGCKQRLCVETVAFTSGRDGFTPSNSNGQSWVTDAGWSTSGTFNNQHSYRECGGRGSCDFETGLCQCFPGFTGVGCRRTSCPNGCSGHGVCVNDDVANYHAAGNTNLPADDKDINTWGNLWATKKFQACQCDGGWGGNDCSLRQCPRGDDPETQCADDLGNDIQYIECTLLAKKEHFFRLQFTDLLGNRYSTRAIVVKKHSPEVTKDNYETVGADYVKAASHSIQTALESLPNFAVPKIEITTTVAVPPYTSTVTFKDGACLGNFKKGKCQGGFAQVKETNFEFDKPYELTFELKFTDVRNSGQQALLEVTNDMKCASGVQPKFENTDDPKCKVTRKSSADLREKSECANRGLCNRKTAECNCFDGYTGLSCDILAQTY